MNITTTLLNLPRPQKRAIQVAIDCLLISACFLLAMWLRLDTWNFVSSPDTWYALGGVIPVTLAVFIRTGFYRAVLRYIGFQAAYTVALGIGASAVAMFVISQLFGWFVPRSVPIIYTLLAIVTIGGSRLVWRTVYAQFHAPKKTVVAVYGAGSAGRQVVASLRSGQEHVPVIFLDEDKSLSGTTVSGLRVYSADVLERQIEKNGVQLVLLALPSLSRTQRQAIIERLEGLSVKVQTIPDMRDLVSGRATVEDIRSVPVEDLLGRDPVPPRPELMASDVTGKTVMVTGAGGSIGSELCRQLLALAPAQLVILEQSEFNLYQIEQELTASIAKQNSAVTLRPVLGALQHQDQIEVILRKFNVETIYHAAAYKHVPLVESNVSEGIRNNVFGTLNLAKAAVAANVLAFILISTDKAVRPTNVMGATKRMAELICQALASDQKTTRFSMVRFGNVLGSSGSVIPHFRRQISAGGPVTVTARDITRYFMTIPEAAQLVIQTGAMAQGGEVFVLDMGEPVRILDLAQRMIRLSGFTPWITGESTPADIEIVFSGLRPGEKLYEELLINEITQETAHPRIQSTKEISLPLAELQVILDALSEAIITQDTQLLRKILTEAPLLYKPECAEQPKNKADAHIGLPASTNPAAEQI